MNKTWYETKRSYLTLIQRSIDNNIHYFSVKITVIIFYIGDAWCNSCGNLRFSLCCDGAVWHTDTYLRRNWCCCVTLPVKIFNRKPIYTPTSLSGPLTSDIQLEPRFSLWWWYWTSGALAVLSPIPPTAESNVWVILKQTNSDFNMSVLSWCRIDDFQRLLIYL